MTQHKIHGVLGGTGEYGVTHDWDCPACVIRADENLMRRQKDNPHRPGSQAFLRWEREQAAADWACDPRGERYWCM